MPRGALSYLKPKGTTLYRQAGHAAAAVGSCATPATARGRGGTRAGPGEKT